MKKEHEDKKMNIIWYILGSIALAVAALIALPKIIDLGSDYLYNRKGQSKINYDEDDWGPEIVKTSELARENKDGEL